MKQILEYYGRTLIAISASACVVWLFFQVPYQEKEGVPAILGIFVEQSLEKKELSRLTGGSYILCMQHLKPKIEVEDIKNCCTGEWISIYDCFSQEEGTLSMQLRNIYKKDKVTKAGKIHADRQRMYFEHTGEYWLEIETKGKGERVCNYLIMIYINKEKKA